MIALYLLSPLLFSSPSRALIAPGLLALFSKKIAHPYAFLIFTLGYLLADTFTDFGSAVAFLGSAGLLFFWIKSDPLPLDRRSLVALGIIEIFLLESEGHFAPDRLAGALSYLFTTLIFVYSEEVFLREILREKIGKGAGRAVILGVLWGIYHLPFYPDGSYIVIQILHAVALSILIDSIYDEKRIASAVALHAVHNALPLFFDASFTLLDHALFSLLLSAFALYGNKRYGKFLSRDV